MEQWTTWIGPRLRCLIEAGLERRDQRVHRRIVWPARALRGHHARAQLTGDLFPDVDVVREVRHIGVLEDEIARLETCVMARDAILIDGGFHRGPRLRGAGPQRGGGLGAQNYARTDEYRTNNPGTG